MRRTISVREARRRWGPPLPRAFYTRDPLRLARALLGKVLVRAESRGVTAGRIVEVEAYAGESDPASHARSGRTRRNAVMYGEGGHAYVYFTYGMHHCFNVVAGPPGVARAVLIRALEPLAGIDLMRRRRGVRDPLRLARGPGCVGQALALDRSHDGTDLTGPALWIAAGERPARRIRVARSPRIGIRQARERLWRFHRAGDPFVSGPGARVPR